MYPSPPSSSARKVSSTFPSTSTVCAPAVSVRAARTAASSSMRRMTSLATPRASTACPPGRSSGARSTTVTSAPRLRNQWASAGPAMLAPATKTLVPLTAAPCSPVRLRVRIVPGLRPRPAVPSAGGAQEDTDGVGRLGRVGCLAGDEAGVDERLGDAHHEVREVRRGQGEAHVPRLVLVSQQALELGDQAVLEPARPR